MRRLLPLLVLVVLAALAAVALAQVESAPAARAMAIAASGSFEITNSDDGQPIFAATGIAPGESTGGTVTIEDTGTGAAALVLHRGELVDSPGLTGGLLSDRLQLTVVDITAPAAPQTIYAGPLDSMPDQHVGEVEPSEARTFEFTATLPESGAPNFQNAVQGASTTVAYSWIAEEANGHVPAPSPAPGAVSGGQGETNAGVPSQPALLALTVPRVRRALRSGRLIVWTNCDETCRLTVRGRILASAGGNHRSAKVRLAMKRFGAPGVQQLRIPIPRGLRRWLRQAPPPKRLRAMLTFIAVGVDGQRDVVRKKVRLRAGGR
ncbi:MAG TPA: hypothetical protein VGH14_15125 [Solirubrobacterales bacterium]|jgi:hypothetical protein